MFLDIDGNKVFTLSFGAGPRTILAHSGWIGNCEDWIATLAPLRERWRTVVYDHRGSGETVVAPERISHEALVDDVFRVMDAMRIERCVMAGFSRGVVTALRAVLHSPDRFDGLLLMNSSGEVTLPGEAPEVADRIFTMQPAEPIDWAERLPKRKLPTLLIHGELDVFCRTEVMQYIHSLIPGSRLVVMEGSGHVPAMTRPMDVAREIEAYFGERIG